MWVIQAYAHSRRQPILPWISPQRNPEEGFPDGLDSVKLDEIRMQAIQEYARSRSSAISRNIRRPGNPEWPARPGPTGGGVSIPLPPLETPSLKRPLRGLTVQ